MLDETLPGGYPDKSAILVEGSSGNEKDALSYRFLRSGLKKGDLCVYVTRLSPSEIIQDAKAFGVDFTERGPFWMSPEGGNRDYSPTDLASVSYGLKDILKGHEDREARIVFDGLSQLLTLHPVDSVYRFLSQLLSEAKKYDSVVLATIQEGMHQPQVNSTMELLFDGVLAVRRTGKGELQVTIKKMRGVDLSARSMVLNISQESGPGDLQLPKYRVAVLPFANISPDPNDEYFAEGLTEELISTMSKVGELSVISRTSTAQYKDKTKSIGKIGRELNAGTILEGSVRKAANRIRVTIQMVEAASDRHVWAESYDRELSDLFAIQSDIAQQVASALKVRLVPTEKVDIEKKPTGNVDAYQLYLRGLFHMHRETREDFDRALAYFEEAIGLDTNFALAYAGISDYYHFGGHRNWFEPEVAFPKMKEFASRAVTIDSRLAEAHAALGAVYFHYEWKWKEAGEEFVRAIELKPSYVPAYYMYHYLLTVVGRFDEAQEIARREAELTPQYRSQGVGGRWYALALLALHLGRVQEGVEIMENIVRADPGFPGAHDSLGFAYYMASRVEEGISELKKAAALSGDEPIFMGDLAILLALVGRKEEATAILNELVRDAKTAYVSDVQVACILHSLGRRDEAFEKLERAFNRRLIDLCDIRGAPWFGQLRIDSRWRAIENRMGLSNA